MLRITVSKHAAAAAKYFEEGLSKQDYYSEKGEVNGFWHGKLSERLGLEGEVIKKEFEAIASNLNPGTGDQLTVRNSANRRAGYDATFSAPKSVSLVYSMTQDEDILRAFHGAIQDTMKEVERDMQTQIGQGKNKRYENTGNIAWAGFTHFRARPVEVETETGKVSVPDPHLHQHCFIFNATWNEKKERFQAIEMGTVKENAPYYEAVFNSKLAKNLQEHGYAIERNERDFELKGFDRPMIEKFSQRTQEIEKKAQELGITYDEDKAALGGKTRQGKRKDLLGDQLQSIWEDRLSEKEKVLIANAKGSGSNGDPAQGKTIAKDALEYALSHHLERVSVITEKRLLGEAIKKGYGETTPEAIAEAYQNRTDILSKVDNRNGEKTITTEQALDEEQKLIQATRDGRGNYDPINRDYQPKNDLLTDEQRKAVKGALGSHDFVSIIAGGAGTGKTWSIKEVKYGVEETGMKFHAFAPSADASRGVQQEEGFEGATTIAELLKSEKLQKQVSGGMIWIDEAGMVGNKTMNKLMDLAKEKNARLLLSGDTQQHNSVERGDALRVMETFGGVKPLRITKIQRQETDQYKEAVKHLSDGRMSQGFERLDQMGAIKEVVDMGSLKKEVAKEYVQSVANKENVLVVATTHAQGQAVTASIRDKLKENGLLGKKDHAFTIQKNTSFTEAQKQDATNYQKGMSIQFHQNAKGIKRGERFDVLGKDAHGNVRVMGEKKKEQILPLHESQKYSVYQKEQIQLAKGDQLRITQNGSDMTKKRLNNGQILTVQGITPEGNIMAKRGKTNLLLSKDYRNFTHGYYTTSPASQGKSVEKVLIMQSSASGRATSKEQFYVSASRGKFGISIYTDDKDFLLKNVQRSTTRTTATEIATNQNLALKDRHQRSIQMYRAAVSKVHHLWERSKERIANINQTIKQHVQAPRPVRTK
ncbi:MAG: MobF family relaxase [Bacteroidota bacterium]